MGWKRRCKREEDVDDPGLRLHLHHLRPEERRRAPRRRNGSSPFDRAVNLILKKVARPSVPPLERGEERGDAEPRRRSKRAESADLSSVSSFVIGRSCHVSTWIINSLPLRILRIIYHMGSDRGERRLVNLDYDITLLEIGWWSLVCGGMEIYRFIGMLCVCFV